MDSQELTKPLAETFWHNYDTFLFDVDGVLYTGNSAIDGAPELIERLLLARKHVFLITNNPTRQPEECLEKYNELGFSG